MARDLRLTPYITTINLYLIGMVGQCLRPTGLGLFAQPAAGYFGDRKTVTGSIRTSVLAALVMAGVFALPVVTATEAASQSSEESSAKAKKPLRGKSYYGRRGGYTVKRSDVIGDTRRQDPKINGPSYSGPLQGDFFWESPRSPYGGNTDYMQ